MDQKRIILIDTWTKGVHLFSPYIDQFLQAGYEIELIHINSINKVSKDDNLRKDIKYVDLSFGGYQHVIDLFNSGQISLILFLSLNSLFLEGMNLLAKEKGIPTVHIYHGLNSLVNWNYLTKTNQIISLNGLISRIQKNLKIFRIQTQLKPSNSSSLEVIKRAIRSSLQRLLTYLPHGNNDSIHHTDFGIVYCKEDAEHMHESYGVDPSCIFINGFPDLMSVPTNMTNKPCTNNVIYISTALTDENIVFRSHDDYLDFLIKVKEDLNSLGYQLILKLKPHGKLYSSVKFLENLDRNGITYFGRNFNLKYFETCAFVLSEPSTYSIIPMFIKTRIGLVALEPLPRNIYGVFFSNYPYSFVYEDISDLRINIYSNRSDVVRWSEENFSKNGKPNYTKVVKSLLSSIHGKF